MFGGVARTYAFGRVAASTRRTYEENRRMWVSWRSFAGNGCRLWKDMGDMELVRELVEIARYCCAGKGIKESTIVSKLVVINFYHGQFLGLSVPLNNPLIRSVRQGIQRAHIRNDNQHKVRRPLAWGMITKMQESSQAWGVGGRVLWIGLTLSYFFKLRASELFVKEIVVFHKVYCLRRRDVSFVRDNEQLVRRKIHESNKVEVRFKRSKGDQRRNGAVLVRTRTGRRGEGERGMRVYQWSVLGCAVTGIQRKKHP